ncbi:hypothetical protein GCM10023093_30680 [Nemorincola caseinilytica]|uniref:Lipocalin-like domain-containing protein n=1 Tax=Nemorincola caseinilytica TaxID=2054315 RepID=A0ABP8NS25_9BACT
MKKILSIVAILLVTLSMACKKKQDKVLPTDMRAALDKDTVLVTSNVTNTISNGVMYIEGVSDDGGRELELAITGFTGAKKIFTIDYRGPGGNMTGNTGSYKDGSNMIMARNGKISVTEVTADVIKGTFTLFYMQAEIRGTFTAPRKG